MKRWILVIWIILATVSSCMKERVQEDAVRHEPGFPEGQPVTIEFSLPGAGPSTKALGESEPNDLNTLHLAVCGGSGYLKEYVPANPVYAGTYTYLVYKDASGNELNPPKEVTAYKYTYSATLTMSESPRTIHLIGNGPETLDFGYDTNILPNLYTTNGEKGYWQMISLPDGIRAKKDPTGTYYVDENDQPIPTDPTDPNFNKGYVPDNVTATAFEEIALIRNWAKIVLSAEPTSNFEPISMAVVNVPARGSIVPYNSMKATDPETHGFIPHYEDKSFTDLSETDKYPANIPTGTDFDGTVPEKDSFESYTVVDGKKIFGPGVSSTDPAYGAVYLYERPAPSLGVQPSYIIVYGTFTDPDSHVETNCYYKIDLMETSVHEKEGVGEEKQYEFVANYYPVYRNFKYQVRINKILSVGQETPEEAAVSAGSADVSADFNTSNLTDISDGLARMTVKIGNEQVISKTYMSAQDDIPLRVKFSVLNAAGTELVPDMVKDHVTLEPQPVDDGGPDIITIVKHDGPTDESDGYHEITLSTSGPVGYIRSQTLRVTGSYFDNGKPGRLYRDIVFTVLGKQDLKVICQTQFVARKIGASQVVRIMIPDGLNQSMFPLDFTIEAEDMTLTPDNSRPDNNLPVRWGTSISESAGYAGKKAFQFIRTITWDEYINKLSATTDNKYKTWRWVDCYFKTTEVESATKIWVENQYFNKGSDFFQNTGLKQFHNLTFNEAIPIATDQTLTVTFEMDEDEDFSRILIRKVGLLCKPEDNPGIEPGPETDTYYYKPTSKNVTLKFVTTTDDGDISVEISADGYDDGLLYPCRFSDVGFVDGMPVPGGYSNCMYGRVNGNVNPLNGKPNASKTLLFAYKEDPRKQNTEVTISYTGGLVPQGFTPTNNTIKYKPTGPISANADPNYREVPFKTGGSVTSTPIDVTISSPGYVTYAFTAYRYIAEMNVVEIKGSEGPQSQSNSLLKIKPGNTSEIYTGKWSDASKNYKNIVSIPEVSETDTKGVHLPGDGDWHDITVSMTGNPSPATHSSMSNYDTTHGLLLVRFWFYSNAGTLYAPASLNDFMPSIGKVERTEDSDLKDVSTVEHFDAYYDTQYIWRIPMKPNGEGYESATLRIRTQEGTDVVITGMQIVDYRVLYLYH